MSQRDDKKYRERIAPVIEENDKKRRETSLNGRSDQDLDSL